MLFRTIVFCLVSVAVWAPRASGKDRALSPAKIQQIEDSIAAEMARKHIPGLSISVGLESGVAWTSGFGLADVENSVPVRAATMYRLASISKPITATAVMQLVEKHKLELDAPIQTYVPAFPEKRWPLTVRQLLAHLGGIRHYRNEAEIDSTRHYTDSIEPLKVFRDDALLFEPGTSYSYSTYGYVLLGAAVEKASGLKFASYLRENIFRPAAMDTIRVDDAFEIIPHRARGYRLLRDGLLRNCAMADTSNKIPAGGLISTPADLVRFALALDSGTLVNRETVDQMFSRQHLANGTATGYGLGWDVFRGDNVKWVGHSGGQQGVSTFLLLAPKDHVSVAIMANLQGLDLAGLSGEVMRLVLK